MEDADSSTSPGKPCRACQDFKNWSKLKKKDILESTTNNTSNPEKDISSDQNKTPTNCPLDREGLGRHAWGFLHTMTAYYPDRPTEEQKSEVHQFFKLFSQFYPCQECAQDLQQQIERFPPKTDSQKELSQWLCRVHNRINLRLGKPLFDCSKVDERWKTGWADGSCD